MATRNFEIFHVALVHMVDPLSIPLLTFHTIDWFSGQRVMRVKKAPPVCAVGALPLPVNPIMVCPFPTSMVVEDLLLAVPEAVYSVVGLVFRDLRHQMM